MSSDGSKDKNRRRLILGILVLSLIFTVVLICYIIKDREQKEAVVLTPEGEHLVVSQVGETGAEPPATAEPVAAPTEDAAPTAEESGAEKVSGDGEGTEAVTESGAVTEASATPVPTEAAAVDQEEDAEPTPMVTATSTPSPTEYKPPVTLHADREAVAGDIVFVGDSRFVGMSLVGGSSDIFIAQAGAGYYWFSQEAVPEADSVLTEGTSLVINMGVNDLNNADKYAKKINTRIDDWVSRGVKVYYLSVNPVIDGKSNATNDGISIFNAQMTSELDPRVVWIDSNSWLQENGFETADGLHYENNTSQNIYNFCLLNME